MLKIIISLLMLVFLSIPAKAKDDWDKAGSFALGAVIGGGLNYGLHLLGAEKNGAMWDAFALTTLVGASKEFYFDQRPDSKEFTANEIGALVGISISVLAFE